MYPLKKSGNINKLDWLQIWVDFKSGDQKAFETIYSTFVDRLFAYGSKITDDDELVKDAIQDLFIDMYHYSIDLKKPESLEFYLIKSLNRIIVAAINQKRRLNTMHESDDVKFDLKFDFEEEFLQKERTAVAEKSVRRILQGLDAQKRELLFLKFHIGLKNREIAEVLNLSQETVKKQLYRLLLQLRTKYSTASD